MTKVQCDCCGRVELDPNGEECFYCGGKLVVKKYGKVEEKSEVLKRYMP